MSILKYLIYCLLLFYPFLELARFNLYKNITFTLNDFLVALAFIVYIILIITKKHTFKGKLSKSIILFAIACLTSFLVNIFNYEAEALVVSFIYLIRWIIYANLYFITVSLDKNSKLKVKKLMLYAGSIIVGIGFMQYFYYPSLKNLYYKGWDEHLYRMFSSFFDPNFAGCFFTLFSIFTLGFLIPFNKLKHKFLLFILFFLSVLAVYLTYSRSAILALITSIIVFLILIKKTKYVIVVFLIFIIMLFLSPRAFKTEGTNILRITSSTERLKNSTAAVEIFAKNPIFGVGFNAYRYSQYKYGYLRGPQWEITHSGSGADNSFLFILATTGVIGFISYIILIRTILINAINYSSKKNKYLHVTVICSLFALIISGFFINSLFYYPLLLWFWILLGITENT